MKYHLTRLDWGTTPLVDIWLLKGDLKLYHVKHIHNHNMGDSQWLPLNKNEPIVYHYIDLSSCIIDKSDDLNELTERAVLECL